MNYIVAGPSIINDIQDNTGSTVSRILGGSVYCVSGLLLWTQKVLYVSKVGSDFYAYFGNWMECNRVPSAGIIPVLPHTHYSLLKYNSSGEYSEQSLYGKEYEEYAYPASRLHGADIAKHCSESTKGIYIEVNENEEIWYELPIIREKTQALIMWEVPSDSVSTSDRREKTLERIHLSDSFSINIPEGIKLFQTSNREELLQRIRALSVPCFLRAGAEGSYWISPEGICFAPSILIGPIVDPTGCGNASTAAALFAFAENLPPEDIPRIANISAAFTILQYGPFPKITAEERILARKLLSTIE